MQENRTMKIAIAFVILGMMAQGKRLERKR
jgi:hypothetical protein